MRNLRMFFLLVLLLTPLISVVAQGPGPEEYNEADLDSSRIWDFGEASEGDILEHVFTLRNDSTAALGITNVNTSCGCTASEVTKKNLAPGEVTEIKVKFNSKGYNGKIKQSVFVNTDSLDKPIIQFIIKADVKKQ